MEIISKGKKYAVVKGGIIYHIGTHDSCLQYIATAHEVFGV